MVEIHKKFVEKMENREKGKSRTRNMLLSLKKRLTEQITHYGGLWLEEDISETSFTENRPRQTAWFENTTKFLK